MSTGVNYGENMKDDLKPFCKLQMDWDDSLFIYILSDWLYLLSSMISYFILKKMSAYLDLDLSLPLSLSFSLYLRSIRCNSLSLYLCSCNRNSISSLNRMC